MQYLLSKEEYDALANRPLPLELIEVKAAAKAAGDAYIAVAGCDREGQGEIKYEGYCDHCPLSDNEHACTKYREYSQ